MTIGRGQPPSPAVVPLAVLLRDVVDAREDLAHERRGKGAPAGRVEAQARVLSALEAYTAALELQRLPVPYALRDELRIHQRVRR